MNKRRTSLKNYFQKAKEANYTSVILGGGEFRKKGSNVKNWKIRSYYIKDDHRLLYFDPVTKEPKGVVDVSEVIICVGPKENMQKSGSSDFSCEVGYSIMISILCESMNMELVFDTKKEAQKFCLLLGYVAVGNIADFARTLKWDDIATAIDARQATKSYTNVSGTDGVSSLDNSDIKRFDEAEEYNSDDSEDAEGEVDGFIKERPTIYELEASEKAAERELFSDDASSDEDDVFTGRSRSGSDASIICSGTFLKQGQFRKNWKKRYFEIWSTGTLLYKESRDSMFVKGRLDLRACVTCHLDVYVPASATGSEAATASSASSPLTGPPGSIQRHGLTMIRVSALEIKSLHDKRVFMITFDVNSAEVNASQMEQFEIVLKRLASGSVISTSEFVSTVESAAAVGIRKRTISSAVAAGNVAGNSSGAVKKEALPPLVQSSRPGPPPSTMTLRAKYLIDLNALIGESVSDFVSRHKDLVLVVGMPVWGLLLMRMCSFPSFVHIFAFCCMTTFFGVHYSAVSVGEHVPDDNDDWDDEVSILPATTAAGHRKNV